MIKFDVVIISNPNVELCRNMASYYPRMPEPGGPLVPPPYLADQLTLFQPGRADYYYWHPQCFSPSGTTAYIGIFSKIVSNEFTYFNMVLIQDVKTKSADVVLKTTTILKEMRIT